MLAFGGLRYATNASIGLEHRRQALFNQPMEIKTLWGQCAWMGSFLDDDFKKEEIKTKGMEHLMNKYGWHHMETIRVRDTEIAARIMESNVGPRLRAYFKDFNDGYLIYGLRNCIRRKDIEYYEMCGTHLSESCTRELAESFTNMPFEILTRMISQELEKNNSFGIAILKSEERR